MDGRIRQEQHGQVLTIVIDRPQKMNAFTLEMYEELAAIFGGLTADGPVRAVLVRGEGGRAFAAGTDIAVFRSLAGSFWKWLADSAAEFGCEVLPPFR